MVRLAIILLALVFALPSPAQANSRYAALVVDAVTGEVFFSRYADRRVYPASLTKVMTLYMTFEALRAGRLSLDRPLTVSARAAAQPASHLGLPAGSTITVEQAIYALVTKSANDVAVVLAEGISGSVAAFAQAMNARARQLGMVNTQFRNPHGLPDSDQWTNAGDMALMARAVIRHFPEFYGYFATENWRFRGTNYRSHNRLLGAVDGVDGIKTGYIRASGYNLIASARRGGLRIIGLVFGGRSSATRNSHMKEILENAFASDRGQLLTAHGSVPNVPLPPAGRGAPVIFAENGVSAGREQAPGAARRHSAVSVGAPPFVVRPPPLPAYRRQMALAEQGAGDGTGSTLVRMIAVGDVRRYGDWAIEVGGEDTVRGSAIVLDQVARTLGGRAATAERHIIPIEEGKNDVYKARIVGLDPQTALAACVLLDGVTSCLALSPEAAR